MPEPASGGDPVDPLSDPEKEAKPVPTSSHGVAYTILADMLALLAQQNQ